MNELKHHTYHRIPNRFADKKSYGARRYWEEERFAYTISKINIKDKSVVDIGCNTAFFSFACLDAGAKSVVGFEGSGVCHPYLEDFASRPGCERVGFVKRYFDFEADAQANKCDVLVCLNVIHHLGDDFGNQSLSLAEAKGQMIANINKLAQCSDHLVLQMGFNWKADVSRCLFENGTKAEMIEFLKEGTKNHWTIQHIGIPRKSGDSVSYIDLNAANISRDDSIGEFLNRPLFIMRRIA